MLQSLYVKNLALIDEAEVEFGEGLNILSGETGAGKSIIIGSINLALGAKADKDMIRSGAEYGFVELVFTVDSEKQREQIEALELPIEDNLVVLQRKIMQNRNVCKVSGETVTAKQLRRLAEVMIDIHGQYEHQSLMQPGKQLELLDNYVKAEISNLKEELKDCFQEYKSVLEELSENDLDEETRKREVSLAEFEANEIAEAAILKGEDEELEAKYQKLVNAVRINDAVNLVHSLCGYDTEGAGSLVGRALRELKAVSLFDDELKKLEEQLLDIDCIVNDFNRMTADYLNNLEFDGNDFEDVERRLNLINHLKSKYGNTIEEIQEYANRAEKLLEKYRDYELYRQKLQEREQQYKKKVVELCGKLSDKRRSGAEKLSKAMQNALVDLNFQEVSFEIVVSPDENALSANGYDKVTFMISTNAGEEMKELSQVASGGEISRIMLALKAVLADREAIETLIFDEIDTGISGKTAWKVSEKMGYLSHNHQIISITHLPQIAAMADHHFCIEKTIENNRAITKIRPLDEEESIRELARMLGSDNITDSAVINAKEMKELAAKSK